MLRDLVCVHVTCIVTWCAAQDDNEVPMGLLANL